MIKLKKLNLREFIDRLFHLCVALLPVLYIINVPWLNISLGTVIILGFTPYSMYYILKNIRNRDRIKIYVFLSFYIYMILRSDGNLARIVLCIATFLIIFGQTKGIIDSQKIRYIIESFALINVVLLILQVICYYVFRFRIQYIPRSIIYEEYQNSYVFRDFTGLYRPSALFLEPSHFSQYCIFALISSLFPTHGKPKLIKAIAIGIGCILTTSGMGIALTAGVFGWYLLFSNQTPNKKIRTILTCLPIAVISLIVFLQIPFFQTAIQRVFSSVDGYNAVSGRIHNWNDAIGTMHGNVLWFGYGDNQTYKLYLTGLADTIYKYGVVCVVLEGICFLYLMKIKVCNYVWCSCVVFVILFCFAHVMNFVAQVFYFGLIIADVYESKTIYKSVRIS